ncbi:small ribosomal subunit protein mS34-like [Glandiceps talaboti]
MAKKITNIHHLVSNFSPFTRKEIFEKFFYTGKSLFNICTSCPRLGVGRMVTRKRWNLLYPEPSYYTITRVRIDCSRPNLDSGRIWGVLTWRGYKDDKEVYLGAAVKREWILVRKSDEEEFSRYTPDPIKDFTVAPSYGKLPPLLKAMVLHQQGKLGMITEEEPKLKLNVVTGSKSRVLQESDVERIKQASAES